MNLSPIEVRVLGCLIEKAATTPEHYPLTTNSLVAACNQKTSRDPVTSYTARQVDEALLLLRPAGYVRSSMGGRSPKHRHIADEALGLGAGQLGVLAVLMLRGPQTPGELRTRTERAVGFDSVEAVDEVLVGLAQREVPLVQDLGRGPGQSQNRWHHLLGDGKEEPLAPQDQAAVHDRQDRVTVRDRPSSASVPAQSAASPDLAAQVARLEARIEALENALGVTPPDQEDP